MMTKTKFMEQKINQKMNYMYSKIKKWLGELKTSSCIPDKGVPCHVLTHEDESKEYEFDGERFILEGVTTYIKRNYPSLNIYSNTLSEAGKISIEKGNMLHTKIQNYLEGREISEDELHHDAKCMIQFKDFLEGPLKDHKLEYCELKVWSPNLKLRGIIDAVFTDKDGGVIVVDWKRSSSILIEQNLLKYKLQVALYAKILEDHYNVKVKRCYVVSFHPFFDDYKYWSFEPKRTLCVRVGSKAPSTIEIDTMSTYHELLRKLDRKKYIVGHEKTKKSTLIESMNLPREIILGEFVEVQGVSIPVMTPTTLDQKILRHPYLRDIIDSGYTSVNYRDAENQTPLIIAIKDDNEYAVKVLLEHGANVNDIDVYKYTPLYYSILQDNDDISKLLIDHGADQNYVFDGKTSLYDLAFRKNKHELCKYMTKSEIF